MLSVDHETGAPQFGGDPKSEYDAVFVGGGHNALICASYLAQRGLSVAVMEARPYLGGLAVCSNGHEDDKAHLTDCAHLLKGLPTAIVKDLKLKKHGLAFSKHNIPTIALDEDGNALHLGKDAIRTLHKSVSKIDADTYESFQATLQRLAKLIEPLLMQTPPSLKLSALGSGKDLHNFIDGQKGLSDAGVSQLTRWLTDSLGEVLEQRFESDLLKGVLAWDAVAGGSIGPNDINAALVLLYRLASERLSGGWGRAYPKGGMHAFINVLSAAATESGVEFFVGRKVKKISIKNGKAAGVVLGDDQEVRAKLVISGADPKPTFLSLVGTEHLETQFIRRLRNTRSSGSLAKLDVHLSDLPSFRGLESDDLASRIVIAPSIAHLQRAASALKYNAWSDVPAFEITFPTLLDRHTHHDGHVMSCLVQYVPLEVEGGWDAARPEFERHVIRALTFYAPDLPDLINDYRLLLPSDIAEEWNSSGGHWHHLELALDQCGPFRPAFGAAQFSVPIENLYLCGAGAHPGGGLMGLPGYNAAQKILSDLGSVDRKDNA